MAIFRVCKFSNEDIAEQHITIVQIVLSYYLWEDIIWVFYPYCMAIPVFLSLDKVIFL